MKHISLFHTQKLSNLNEMQNQTITSFQKYTGLLAGVGTSKQISSSSVDSTTKYLYRPVAKAAGLCFFISAGKLQILLISMKKQKIATEKANLTLPPYRPVKSELKTLENLKKHLGRGFSKYFNIS